MCKLIIEIEASDENIISLLDHIREEINDPWKYRNEIVEGNACVEGIEWLSIKDGPLKGKYRWNKL